VRATVGIDVPATSEGDVLAVEWVHGGVPPEYFAGRAEELARLDRWATDQSVRLIGVTAWGGAGKTALVTHWLMEHHDAERRPGIRGVFAWSFYENPSEDAWAEALLDWAAKTFSFRPAGGRLGDCILALLECVPLVVVLDGLELLQEGPEGAGYGRLLGGLLRDVLTRICRFEHGSLAILTSRFPFADVERFDGGAARMLDVPPLTAAQGSELLARTGGKWMDSDQRRALVIAVDGHALAVSALAGALTDPSARDETGELLEQLQAMARTDKRVQRVLSFYAERLTEQDRVLVAIVSLFQRPVKMESVLALGASSLLEYVLAEWTPTDVRTAVQQRLTGLLSWHADFAVSAHPLVRDSFRPFALYPGSAHLAVELTLDGLPAGRVHTREHALSVVEMIELLLAADQWDEADGLHRSRTEDGAVWTWLPAARMGQRCALAFVGTPARRATCEQELGLRRLTFHLNDFGVSASRAGDMMIAAEYLRDAADCDRAIGDYVYLGSGLCNLVENLMLQGLTEDARDVAREAVAASKGVDDNYLALLVRAYQGWVCDAAGEVAAAERLFLDADRLQYDTHEKHLVSNIGTLWAQFLLRTRRLAAARRLSEACLSVAGKEEWNEDVARAEWALGRCDLVEGLPDTAGQRFKAAATVFRDGDYLCDLAGTLVDLAEQQRSCNQVENAERICNEAIEIAAPRELVPAHAAALAARARIRADRHKETTSPPGMHIARDDADHALRLSSRTRQLPWQQLDALRAHAHIDRIEGTDNGWANRARVHYESFVPADLALDPDALASVEAEASNQIGDDAAGAIGLP